MTPQPPLDGPRAAPGPAHEPPAEQCTRCGAIGTHYLTCPSLRLPSGYRLDAGPLPERDAMSADTWT